MAQEPTPTNGTGSLRSLLRILPEVIGVFVALWRHRKRSGRPRPRPRHKDNPEPPSIVAYKLGRPDDPSVTNCVLCHRSIADVGTLGCGGINRKGQCPALLG